MKYIVILFILTLFSSCNNDEVIFSSDKLIESKFYKISGKLNPSDGNLIDIYSVYFDQKSIYQLSVENLTNSEFIVELIHVKTGEKYFTGGGFKFEAGGTNKNQIENDEYHLKIKFWKEPVNYTGSISGLISKPIKL